MKNTFVYILLICVFGCGQIKKNDKPDTRKEFYNNGKIKEECEYLNNKKHGINKKYFADGKKQEYALYSNDSLLYSEKYSNGVVNNVYRKINIDFNKNLFHVGDTIYSLISVFGPEAEMMICAEIKNQPIDSISSTIESIPVYKNKGYFGSIIKQKGKLFLNVQIFVKYNPPYALLYYKKINVLN